MTDSNSSIRYRNQGGLTYDESMPEWLKRQFVQRTDSEGGNGPYWMAPEAITDEEGNQVMLADDRGDIYANGERTLNEGASSRFIPGLGYAANMKDTTSTGKHESRRDRNRLIAALVMAAAGGAGALAGGAGAAGGAAAGEGLALSGSGSLGAGAGMAGAGTVEGLGAAGGLAGLGSATSGGAGAPAGGGGLTLGATGEAGVGAGNIGTGVTGGLGAAPEVAPGLASGAGATGSTVGGGSNLLNSLGGPSNLIRGAMGLATLGGSHGGTGGGPTDANSIIQQMADANRVNHNTPIGSRAWTQGADGRWTVNDTMDPTEEANFRNVQGLNTDVTAEARRRFAEILAAPPRQRYDRPLGG